MVGIFSGVEYFNAFGIDDEDNKKDWEEAKKLWNNS